MDKNKSIKDLLIKYFKAHPKKDMSHGPIVDWVEEQYKLSNYLGEIIK